MNEQRVREIVQEELELFKKDLEPDIKFALPSLKQRAGIKDWVLYKESSLGPWYFSGTVVNHPKLGTRSGVTTSKVLRIDFEKKIAETLNTIYTFE